VVETRFEQLDQGFAGVATTTLGFQEVLMELLLHKTIHALQLLLLAQLHAVVGQARARRATMLARLAVALALGIERPTCALQEQISTLATRELALGAYITCHGISLLNTTTLGRPATVVRYRSNIRNTDDLDAKGVEGTYR